MNTDTLPPLVLIAGPTASGKSALAMALADMTPSVIINADSMQVYRDLRVVTARPSPEDEARHPHALFGHIDGAIACSAAAWAKQAEDAIAIAHLDARLPILVGGSGLYIRTLLGGIAPVPEIVPKIRNAVRALPVAEAYALLQRYDSEMARRLRAVDTTRVARALEVVQSTGRSLLDWQDQKTSGIASKVRIIPIILTPDVFALDARIDLRLDTMMELGCEEVAALMTRALDPMMPVMRAIGVRELDDLNANKTTITQARQAMRLATRQYAKRQRTWFTKQVPATWWRFERLIDALEAIDIATILAKQALTE